MENKLGAGVLVDCTPCPQVRRAVLSYGGPGKAGKLAEWKVYGEDANTIFEVESDTWTSDKSFHMGGHEEFGITFGH